MSRTANVNNASHNKKSDITLPICTSAYDRNLYKVLRTKIWMFFLADEATEWDCDTKWANITLNLSVSNILIAAIFSLGYLDERWKTTRDQQVNVICQFADRYHSRRMNACDCNRFQFHLFRQWLTQKICINQWTAAQLRERERKKNRLRFISLHDRNDFVWIIDPTKEIFTKRKFEWLN